MIRANADGFETCAADRSGKGFWKEAAESLVEAADLGRFDANALIDDRRRLALDVALQIYSRFGWSDPPIKELEEAQQKRFGQPIHF